MKRILRVGNDEVAIYVELAEDTSDFKRGRGSFCHSSRADAPDVWNLKFASGSIPFTMAPSAT